MAYVSVAEMVTILGVDALEERNVFGLWDGLFVNGLKKGLRRYLQLYLYISLLELFSISFSFRMIKLGTRHTESFFHSPRQR